MAKEKSTRGNSSQFFVAGELCRRGYSAVVTLGNTPNTDVLCSNIEGTKFVHLQVKTYVPGGRTCSVGMKAEKTFGPNFFWVLCGLPKPDSTKPIEYYVIPSSVMSHNIIEDHRVWLETPGKNGQKHNDNSIRTVKVPPYKSIRGWDIGEYFNRWDLIEDKLST